MYVLSSLIEPNFPPPSPFFGFQAIKKHDDDSLKQSIPLIKSAASDVGVLAPLDVFRVLEGSATVYAMTLMALCGVHGRKKMVQLLLDEGASKSIY